jgi:hypothetical protein
VTVKCGLDDNRTHAENVAYNALAMAWMCLLVALPASAGIVGCDGVKTTPGFKILLDDIVIVSDSTPPDPYIEDAMSRIRSNLEAKAATALFNSETPIRCLRCPNRRPSGPTDFDNAAADYLDNQGVVLEIWGKLVEDDRDGSYSELHYVVIPMLLRPPTSSALSAIFDTPVPLPNLTLSRVARILSLFAQADDLVAYSALSVGLNHLANKQYEPARTSLCKAKLAFRKNHRDALVKYLDSLDSQLRQEALQDSRYKGVLKLSAIGACDASR